MSKFKMLSLILTLTVSLTVFAGCGSKNDVESSDKPVIAVSIVPEKTFVEKICGEHTEVVSIIPPGSSPENYEPSPKEIQKISDAKIYFSIGVPAEETNIMPSISDETIKISLNEIVKGEYSELKIGEGRDPHIWLSPKRVIVMVETIRDEMIKLDPDNKSDYEKNAEDYINKLKGVDEEIKGALEGVSNRKFIVFHPAFGYLADDYDLEMYPLEEEGKEATPKHLQEMIDLAKNEEIKVIFYQDEIDSSQSKAFAEEIGGETIGLSPLSPDYIDNMKEMARVMAGNMK